jgi:hypothetical protein
MIYNMLNFFVRIYCIMVVALTIGASWLNAQPVGKPAQSRIIIRVISLNAVLRELTVPTARGLTNFTASTTSFSDDIEVVTKAGVMIFYRDSTQVEVSSNLGPVPPPLPFAVGQFTVDPEVNRYLVLLSRVGSGSNASYSIYAVADNNGVFPNEHVRVINFASMQVALQMGDQRVTINSGADRIMAYPSGDVEHVTWSLAKADPTGWKLMSRTEMTFPLERRVFIMITPGVQTAGDVQSGVSYVKTSELETKLIYDKDTSLPEAKGNKGAE